ncbi:MAG: hypothetical protein ACK4MX_10465 [Thermaurantiacus sp.]
MGKWVANDVLDGAFGVIASATRMVAVNGQPASFMAAMAGRLAEADLVPADFALAPGDISGRKVSVLGKQNVSVTSAGVANHVALLDTVGSRLLYVTTCPEQALPAGGTVSFETWSIEIGDPV